MIDPQCRFDYRPFARECLKASGYNNTMDVDALAARLADTVQDFIAELENEEDT